MAELHPRRWWAGPLDVEGLALDAVDAVRAAITRLAAEGGRPVEVTTTPELVAASYATIEHLRIDGRAPTVWAAWSGFVRAADGWVRLHGNYPHHAAAIGWALHVDSREGLERAVAALPAAEVERRVHEAGGVTVAVRSEAEWSAHPQAVATTGEPWWTSKPGGERAPLGTGSELLGGVRVLDLTRVIAGPTCAQLLACLGADVLRIDPPERPELLDAYVSNAMGKRSVELDLRSNGDLVRERLLPEADVVLLGYRPGALRRFGLDAEALASERPDLVVGSLSAWGEHGPWARRTGFDSIVQAACGIAMVCGEDERPGALPVQALDHSTGLVLASGILDLLADARGGVIRADLLGAARDLLARPRTPGESLGLAVPTTVVASSYGEVVTVPPPVLVDGRPLTAAISTYAAGPAAWRR